MEDYYLSAKELAPQITAPLSIQGESRAIPITD